MLLYNYTKEEKNIRYERWLHRITSMDKYQGEAATGRDKRIGSKWTKTNRIYKRKIVEIPKIKV